MKRFFQWLRIRRVCAWCGCWLGGNPLAKTISHGICPKCRSSFIRRCLILSLILVPTLVLHAAIDENRLADAIYVAEGGKAAKSPYGVLSIKVHSKAEARRVCINSIRNNKRRFGNVSDAEFIRRMADRWCPKSADPIGNRNWKRNVSALYFRHKK